MLRFGTISSIWTKLSLWTKSSICTKSSFRSKPEKIKGLPKIIAISGAAFHALFLDFEGSVWSCGSNSECNLGFEDMRNRNKPEKIPGLPKIKLIGGGEHFSMFVDEEGSVWICGSNEYGELGLGHTTQINKPVKAPNLSGIVSVAGGWRNSMFLDKEGNVFVCGNNAYGQLGLAGGDTPGTLVPKKLELPPIKQISAGSVHSLFLDEEGNVWACGLLAGGGGDRFLVPTRMCGLPKIIYVAGGNAVSVFIDFENRVWTLTKGGAAPVLRPELPPIYRAAAGEQIYCLDFDGDVWCNCDVQNLVQHEPKYEEFRRIENLPKITCISCGNGFVHFVDLEGNLWGAGNNTFGKIGLENQSQVYGPTKIPGITVRGRNFSAKSARKV